MLKKLRMIEKLRLLKKMSILKAQVHQERAAPAANVGVQPRVILGPEDRNGLQQQLRRRVTPPSLVISASP